MLRIPHRRICQFLLTCFLLPATVLWGDGGDDLYNLSLVEIRQKRYDSVVETLEKLLKEYPNHAKAEIARFRLGLTYLTLKKYEAAQKNLRTFIASNERSEDLPEAMYRLAYASFQLNQMPQAEKEFLAYHKQFPEHEYRQWSLAYLGYAQLQNKQAEAAINSFQASIKEFQEGEMLEDAQFGLARAFESTNQIENAVTVYRRLADNPTGLRNEQALLKLGNLYYDRQEYPAAAKEYTSLAQKFPRSELVATARMNAGYAYYQAGDFAAAEPQFEAAAKFEPQKVTAAYWQGLCEKSQKKYEEAAASFAIAAESLGMTPQAATVRFQWADAELKAGDYAEARKLFESVVAADPKSEKADDAIYLAAESALSSQQPGDAVALLDRFEKEYPASDLKSYGTLLRGRLAISENTDNSLERAEALLTKLLNSEPQESPISGLARFQLARVQEKQNRYAESLVTLEPLTSSLSDQSSPELFESLLIAAESHRQLAVRSILEARPLRKQLAALQKLQPPPDTQELQTQIEELTKSAETSAGESLKSSDRYLSFKLDKKGAADVLSIQTISAAIQGDKSVAKTALAQIPNVTTRAALTFEMAEIVYDRADYEWAAELFAALVELDQPTWKPAALSGLGWSRFEQKQYPESAAAFARLVSEFPQNELAPEAGYLQGDALRLAGETAQAEAAFAATFKTYRPEQISESVPNTGPAYYASRAGLESARLLRELKKLDEANARFEQVLDHFPTIPNSDRIISEWAVMNANAGQYTKSDELFKRLLESNPEGEFANEAKLSLAESDLIAKRVDPARRSLQQLVTSKQIAPDLRRRAMVHLVRLEIQQSNWEDVRKWSEAYANVFPDDPFRFDADFYQAEALLNQGELESAKKLLDGLYEQRNNEYLKAASWRPRLWIMLADIAVKQKEYARVESLAKELAALPETEPFQYQMQEIVGRSLKNRAQFDEAIAAFQSVINDEYGSKTETAAKSQFLIAETHLLQKEYKTALSEYLKVYVIYQFPDWQAPALYQAGQCDEALSQWDKALTTYEDLIRDFPKSEYAELAKKRIVELKRKKS